MTKKEEADGNRASRLLAKWLKRLRLGHWDVALVSVHDTEFEREPGSVKVGEVHPWPDQLRAIVTLAVQADDLEQTVLHEVLHIGGSEMFAAFAQAAAKLAPDVAAVLQQQYKDAEERWTMTLERAIWDMTHDG